MYILNFLANRDWAAVHYFTAEILLVAFTVTRVANIDTHRAYTDLLMRSISVVCR